jgi:hypothetical protein
MVAQAMPAPRCRDRVRRLAPGGLRFPLTRMSGYCWAAIAAPVRRIPSVADVAHWWPALTRRRRLFRSLNDLEELEASAPDRVTRLIALRLVGWSPGHW